MFFKPPSSAYFMSHFPLVPPLKNIKKWLILVSLLNLPELGFAGSSGSAVCAKMFSDGCALRKIVIKRSPNWRRSVFQAAEFGLLFESFSLGPPFEEFQKMADFGVFAKFAKTRLCGQLLKRCLRQNVFRWLLFAEILMRRSPNWRQSVFQAAEFGLFLSHFPLVFPLKNFKKWPILVSLLNLPELGFAGSFGSAVCAKMFSDGCALREY